MSQNNIIDSLPWSSLLLYLELVKKQTDETSSFNLEVVNSNIYFNYTVHVVDYDISENGWFILRWNNGQVEMDHM